VIAVRRARESDCAEMGRIYVDAWQDTYPGLLPDRGLLAMSADRHAAHWAHVISRQTAKEAFLIAEDDVYGVIGLASAGPSKTRDLPFGAEVFTLYVDPNHQRLGAGRALLENLFNAMRQAGQRSAVIWALDGNPARTFYERLGGAEVGRRTRITFGEPHVEVAYGWPDMVLGDGARAAEN
jgi:ribosomal protein S18 acetylase RimI-like enzyme